MRVFCVFIFSKSHQGQKGAHYPIFVSAEDSPWTVKVTLCDPKVQQQTQLLQYIFTTNSLRAGRKIEIFSGWVLYFSFQATFWAPLWMELLESNRNITADHNTIVLRQLTFGETFITPLLHFDHLISCHHRHIWLAYPFFSWLIDFFFLFFLFDSCIKQPILHLI